MDDTELAEIELRLIQATPPPWRTDRDEYPNAVTSEHANICGLHDGGQTRERIDANARFIAHAPEDVAALIDSLRGERERASQLAAALNDAAIGLAAVYGSDSSMVADAREALRGVVSSTQPEEYDEMKTELGPDTSRTPTEADQILAGTLSTIWPMSSRHPSDALHLAIFVNDNFVAESVSSSAAKEET